MNLRLYERRTKSQLIDGWTSCETNCVHCNAKNSVNALESLRPNIHNQKDERGCLMMEQCVSCSECGEEWVDVFCRIYPECMDLPDAESDEFTVNLQG